MTVAGVVLAAGGGTRFARSGGQGPKPLAQVRGVTALERVLLAATAAQLDEVVLVDGAVDLREHRGGATHLHNPRWDEGIATSLQLAVGHASRAGHEAVVVGLADQPGVPSDAWRAVADAPGTPPIAVATYDDRRANPVRLMASVWDLLPVTGDEGARALMRARPDLVREVRCTGDPWDIDTVEDLERWS